MSVNSLLSNLKEPLLPALVGLGLNDLQEPIFQLLDNKSLIALSCTNLNAYSVLTNDTFFKERFMELYKPFHPTPKKLFPHFQKYYPDCCWKISSCLYPDTNPIVVFNKAFLQEALPYSQRIHEKEMIKSNQEEELQNICGITFADPNSRIHKAYEAYQAALKPNEESLHMETTLFWEYRELDTRKYDIEHSIEENQQKINTLNSFFGSIIIGNTTYIEGHAYQGVLNKAQIDAIINERRTQYEEEIRVLKNEMQNICGIGFADPNSRIHKAYEAHQAAHKANQWIRNLGESYENCESSRSKIELELVDLSQEIDSLRNNGHRDIHLDLLVDQYFFRHQSVICSFHNYGKLNQLFLKIKNWTNGAYFIPQTHYIKSERLFSEMKNTHPELHGMILEILYHAYGEKNGDDRWAERHCGEFAPSILRICDRLISNYMSIVLSS